MDLITTKTITRIFWIAINLSCLTIALKDVRVTVPAAVKRGDNANLTCHYDLENDTLYSIKWYKGKREFYRYTPKEDIPMKVFTVTGITVERSMSNASNVMLISMEPNSTGKYSCEVSADAPTFHTSIVSGELEVVDLPKIPPRIDIDDKIYSIGNMLLANCTVDNSKPLTNLTWLLNNSTLRPHEIIRYNIIGDSTLNSTTSVLGLKLVLQSKHFRYKNLRLACKASIYNIYENTTEKILELNTTSNQIYTDDFITIGSSRHTQYDGDLNGYGDPYDNRMHHMQASPDRSTSASSCSKCCSSLLLFFLTATTLCGGSSTSNIKRIRKSDKNNNNNSNNNDNNDNRNNKINSDHHTRINNTNSKGNSSCYDIGINSNNNNNDSIQSIVLLEILLRILKLFQSISSFLFILINWSNVHLKGLINIINIDYEKYNMMMKEKKNYIKNNIQVLLSKSILQSLSSSLLLLSSTTITEKSTTEKKSSIKLSLSLLFLSFLFSLIRIVIILISIIWSIVTLLKYHDVSDLLLVKIQKLNDICGYDIDSCCYSYNNNICYCWKFEKFHIKNIEYYWQMEITVLKKYSTVKKLTTTATMTMTLIMIIMILMIISLILNQVTLLLPLLVIFIAIVKNSIFSLHEKMLKHENCIR